ncbi:unnamed protein product, partial [Medioppia subpectinata]
YNANQITIRLGEHHLYRDDDFSKPIEMKVLDVKQHSKFQRHGFFNDIGLIRLKDKVVYSSAVSPICLPNAIERSKDLVGYMATVIGWGTVQYGGPGSGVLQQVSIPIWDNNECDKRYFQPINKNFLCAGYVEGGKDACQGDSGSPLMVSDLNRKWTLYGVVFILEDIVSCRKPYEQYANLVFQKQKTCQFFKNGYVYRGPLPIRIPIPIEPVIPLNIDHKVVIEAAKESQKIIKEQLTIEKELIRAGFFQRNNTMESFHQAFFGPDDPEIQKLSLDGLVALETTLQLAKRYQLTPLQARDGLHKFSLLDTPLERHCPETPICDRQSKYRTADGNCNNLDYPLWGKSLTQFNRLVPPSYADGLNDLRVSVDGGELPSAREVSCKLALDFDIPDRKFSLLVMQWGQIIDHDLTLTASTRATTGEGLHCCNEEARRATKIRHPACKPIIIPRDDPFYAQHNHFCNNFVRNAAGPKYDCNLGKMAYI